MVSTSNIEISEHFHFKVWCKIVDASWYVPNTVIRTDLLAPTVIGENRNSSSQYNAHLSLHPDDLVVNLMAQPDSIRRFRRHPSNDLPTRF
jgi:hypothetical protein